uniref:ShKT domain-containing protein n=1 Tax=Ditylenchus dipsaci TaxID=166011 RepID=A0A915CL53_9BILA
MDDVQANGLSDCPRLRHRCWDPKWTDLMRDQCPVSCGLCIPSSLNDFKRWMSSNNNNKRRLKQRRRRRKKPRLQIPQGLEFRPNNVGNQSEYTFNEIETNSPDFDQKDVQNADNWIENLARPDIVVGDLTSNPERNTVAFKEDIIVNYPELLQSINRDISPCDNFYSHVCDGFVRNTDVEEGKESVNQYSLAGKRCLQGSIRFWKAIGKADSIPPLSTIDLFPSSIMAIQQINSLIGTLKPQEISDYLEWQILLPFLDGLGDRFLKEREKFNGRRMDLRKYCRDQALYYFPHHMDRLYAKRFLKEEVRLEISSIVNSVTDAFKKSLQTNNWMTSKFTILKRYKDYKLKKEMSFVEILWKLDEWEMNYLLRTFSQPLKYYDHSLRVDAEYVRQFNLMFLHAGILVGAFYKDNLPMSMQIGDLAISSPMNCSMALMKMAIFTMDLAMKKIGGTSLQETNSDKIANVLLDSIQTEVNESRYMPLDGTLTLAENMADNYGLNVAYDALQTSNQKDVNDIKIKGLEDYSDEQLFFVNTAFILCDKHTPESKLLV